MSTIIDKTAQEEGRYAEAVAIGFYKNCKELGCTNSSYYNNEIIDVSKHNNFQKKDIDILSSKYDIEVKNDTWVVGKHPRYPNGTGNITYEFATHVPSALYAKIFNFVSRKNECRLDDILNEFPELHERFVGCNEKCQAHQIFLVGTDEEKTDNRKYKVANIWVIRNEDFKNYAHNVKFKTKIENGKEWIRFVLHKEDGIYNILIVIPIKNLVKKQIAHEMPKNIMANFLSKFPELKNYHTSQEIEEKIKGDNTLAD